MPQKLCTLQSIQKFRKWLHNETKSQIKSEHHYDEIMLDVIKEISKARFEHSTKLFGFLACLSKLCHAFRWGILPLLPSSLYLHENVKSIIFPRYLMEVWYTINMFYGLPTAGGTASLLYANCILDSPKNDKLELDPVYKLKLYSTSKIRFCWNDNKLFPEGYRTEKNGFILFMKSVIKTYPLMLSISECIEFFFEVCNESHPPQINAKLLNNKENGNRKTYPIKYFI
eukprot:UN02066